MRRFLTAVNRMVVLLATGVNGFTNGGTEQTEVERRAARAETN